MRLSVALLASYTDDEYSSISFGNQVFPFLGSNVGVHVEQILRMDEMYIVGQERGDLRIDLTNHLFCAAHSRINACNDAFQKIHSPLFGRDDTFPVPLVYIE